MADTNEKNLQSHYEVLNPANKEARILEVAPGNGKDIIQCTLKLVSFLEDPPPEYETISYCWGSPEKTAAIMLNGFLVSVPASSEAALKRMRLSNSPRVLWIDAICINQSSLPERSQQVALMSTIYSKGKRNLIYLGEDDAGQAKSAAESVESLVSEMSAETDGFKLLRQIFFDWKTHSARYSLEKTDVEINPLALVHLFNLSWFRRLWVLQEACLASSNTCHWGELEFDLLNIVRAVRWIFYKRQILPHVTSAFDGLFCINIMSGILDPLLNYTYVPYLAYSLYRSQCFQKTEPRDGIYAMLGLLAKDDAIDETDQRLHIDYTKPLSEVLQDATRYALCEAGDLRVLYARCHDVKNENYVELYPRWALRADLHRQVILITEPGGTYQANHGLDRPSLLDDISQGADVLLGEGILVDRVEETSPTWESEPDFDSIQNWFKSAKDIFLRRCKHKSLNNSASRYFEMACTMTTGKATSGLQVEPDDLIPLTDFLENFNMENTSAEMEENEIDQMIETLDDLCKTTMLEYCRNRQIFATLGGQLGLGRRDVQPNDLIVVLRGGELPFILRERADGYDFIGDAYVHGIMNGEAVDEWKKRDTKETVFPIR